MFGSGICIKTSSSFVIVSDVCTVTRVKGSVSVAMSLFRGKDVFRSSSGKNCEMKPVWPL